MTTRDLLATLELRGVQLKPTPSGRLQNSTPPKTLTDDLRTALQEQKAELLVAWLAMLPERQASP